MKKGTIKIGSVFYPCRITMGAMIRFKRAAGYDISKMESGDLEAMLLFIHCCAVAACNADDVEFNMDFMQFCDKIDSEEVTNFFAETEQKKTEAEATK